MSELSAWADLFSAYRAAELNHKRNMAEIRKQREEREKQEKAAEMTKIIELRQAEKHKYITIKEADSLTGGIEIWTSLAKHGILLRETFMIKYNSKLSDDEFVEKATELICDHCHEIRNKSTELRCADCRVSRDKAAKKKSELRYEQEREREAELRRYYCSEKAEKKRQEKERLEAEAKLSPEEREALESKREEEKNRYITCDEARKLPGGVEIWKRLAKQKIWKELAKQGILFREEFMKIYNSK